MAEKDDITPLIWRSSLNFWISLRLAVNFGMTVVRANTQKCYNLISHFAEVHIRCTQSSERYNIYQSSAVRSNSVHSCCATLNLGQVGYISRKLKFAVGPRANGIAFFVPKAEKAFIKHRKAPTTFLRITTNKSSGIQT